MVVASIKTHPFRSIADPIPLAQRLSPFPPFSRACLHHRQGLWVHQCTMFFSPAIVVDAGVCSLQCRCGSARAFSYMGFLLFVIVENGGVGLHEVEILCVTYAQYLCLFRNAVHPAVHVQIRIHSVCRVRLRSQMYGPETRGQAAQWQLWRSLDRKGRPHSRAHFHQRWAFETPRVCLSYYSCCFSCMFSSLKTRRLDLDHQPTTRARLAAT